MPYKVWNTEECIACELCVQLCNNWVMNKDGSRALPKKKIVDELGCNLEAEENCPVKCIHHEKVKAKN